MESSLCKCISSTQAKILSYWILPYSAPCRAVILTDFLSQQPNQNTESRKVAVFLWSCPYLGKRTNLTWTSHFSKDRLNLQVLGQPSGRIYMAKNFSLVKGPSLLVWGSRLRIAGESLNQSSLDIRLQILRMAEPSIFGWLDRRDIIHGPRDKLCYCGVLRKGSEEESLSTSPSEWCKVQWRKKKIPLQTPSNFLVRDTTLLHREV